MGIRTSATAAENAAAELAHWGRGFLRRRERRLERLLGGFVDQALSAPNAGSLPKEVRQELDARIEHTIYKLEVYVCREGERSARRAVTDTGLVQHVYALRKAQQYLRRSN